MIFAHHLFRISILVCFALCAWAQNYRIESINAQSGILSDHVNDIAQNTDGVIWISTAKGVSLYDGLKFQNYKDSATLFPISTTSRLKVVSTNRVVIAGLNSAAHFVARYFKDTKWINLGIPDSADFIGGRFWDAEMNGDDLLFKYTNGTTLFTYSYQQNAWTSSVLPDVIHHKCNKIIIKNGLAILLTREGIYEETGAGWRRLEKINDKLKDKNVIDAIFNNSEDSVWLLGNNWLARVQDDAVDYVLIDGNEVDARFRELKESEDGFLLFRSNRFFYWYHIETGTWKSFLPQDSNLKAPQSKLFVDKENGLWITSYRGAHYFASFLFSGLSLNEKNGLPDAEVSMVKEISLNTYLIGWRGGYNIFKNDSIIYTAFLPEGQIISRFMNATTDGDNTTYIGATDLGVGILQSDYKIKWIPPIETSITLVSYLKDTLWAMDRMGELYFLKNNVLHKKTTVGGYPRSIMQMENGNLLISTQDGVKIMEGSSINFVNRPPDLTLREVYCSFVFANKIYLGTEGGLAVLENGVIRRSEINGIGIERAIYAAIVEKNQIWLGTDNGIYHVNESILNHYDEKSGLLGWEINRGAFIKDSMGRLVIGTNKGINFYDPLHSGSKELCFKPSIEWIKTTKKTFLNGIPIDLPADDNFITIGIRSITFTGIPIQVRYRMVGFQDEWQILPNPEVRVVLYRNLPSGTFTFEFQARLANSEWSDSVSSQRITLNAPFYRTYLFFFAVLASAIGVGYGIRSLLSSKKLSVKLQAEIQDRVYQLKKSETKLELALVNSKMGVWMYDIKNDNTEFSSEMYEVLDMVPDTEPPTRENYLSIVYEGDRKRVIGELNQAVLNHTIYDLEVRFLLRDGGLRWLSIRGKAIYDEKGIPEYLTGTMSDISLRKKQEEDRENLILELEKTNEELDRFIYSVSHDLSAPIKSVQGLINLAKMQPLTPDISTYLNLIERSVTRQNDFIKEIVEYGRNARLPLSVESVNVNEVINNIIEDLKFSEHFAKTEIELNIEPDLVYIDCDKVRLKIILNNLLSNAFKYRSRFREQHQVTISLLGKPDRFFISVQDNGIGIDEIHIVNLFSMFYRATDQQPGSGIGLYIANEAAKKIGCVIEIDSKLGDGSTFTLRKIDTALAI